MPASRWNQSIIDLLSWFDDLDELQQELFLRPITPRVLDKDEQDQSTNCPSQFLQLVTLVFVDLDLL